jgi:membrane protein
MSGEPRADRVRELATRVVETVGGIPAVRTLVGVLAAYDAGGGGLMAAGLAYSALFALVPGTLLVAGAIGLFVSDPELRAQIVAFIAEAVPPLADVVNTALESVAAGAVPTSIIALIGLLWGASRFYAALDYAFSKVFHGEPRRNEIVRTLRGLLVAGLLIGLPIAAVVASGLTAWLQGLAPDDGLVEAAVQTLVQLASPAGTVVLFVGSVALVYRFVPPKAPGLRALLPPALVVGVLMAAFTQLFTLIAPRMVGFAALFGTFVAIFALLIWLSISCNMLILGAAWTRVRAVGPEIEEGTTAAAGVAGDQGGDADAG